MLLPSVKQVQILFLLSPFNLFYWKQVLWFKEYTDLTTVLISIVKQV